MEERKEGRQEGEREKRRELGKQGEREEKKVEINKER